MKSESIYRTVKVIERYINIYQEEILDCLEMKAELELKNGNIEVDYISKNCEDDIEQYKIILTDLATIRRAIKKGKDSVKIYGDADNYQSLILAILEEARVRVYLNSIKNNEEK